MNTLEKSNVINLFPRNNDSENIPNTPNEALDYIQNIKYEIAKEVTETAFENTLGMMRTFGFFNDHRKIVNEDLQFIEEALMSALCRYQGIPHPMHELVDSMFDEEIEEIIEEDSLEDI